MLSTRFTFRDSENIELSAVRWSPEFEKVKGVFQVVHGMAEHSDRYQSFAEHLTRLGFTVYGHDHRGHGRSAKYRLGKVKTEDCFHTLVDGIQSHYSIISKQHPDLPHIVLGHSMGSFLVQRLMQITDLNPSGIIYSGSNGKPPFLLNVGIVLSKFLTSVRSPQKKSPLINYITFGEYNKHFKPNRTEFDWLSRDTDEVDKYIQDPFCGFVYSTKFYRDLFLGLKALHNNRPFADHPGDIPILLISGDQDPVSDMGKGVRNLEQLLINSGVKDLTLKLYPGGRHEMLHETNRDIVMKNITDWLEEKI